MERAMKKMVIYAVFLQGVLGAPFVSEEAATQFLRLKRQAFSQHFWEPENVSTLTDQAAQTLNNFKHSAEYYIGTVIDGFNTGSSAVGSEVRHYINYLWTTKDEAKLSN
ncbi:hypothetical protein GDO86_003510 [Hymenochirus boettgeri]|uniref:Apolipoprotein C2 n=1 Tax=Hymenochirus boettgeri TaxID=247094 RepID=A0A8T2K3Y3_9PIPI|nr:hypothetical protein GDO86_003510 [Hymenochirus boettgeri]